MPDVDERPGIAYQRSRHGMEGMRALHRAAADGGLAPRLVELVRVRVSQVNRCQYCIDLHSGNALAAGETPRRLFALAAWPDSPLFCARERAALALADALTGLGRGGVPQPVLQDCRERFPADALVALLYAIVEVNAWNRLAIAARKPLPDQPGSRG